MPYTCFTKLHIRLRYADASLIQAVAARALQSKTQSDAVRCTAVIWHPCCHIDGTHTHSVVLPAVPPPLQNYAVMSRPALSRSCQADDTSSDTLGPFLWSMHPFHHTTDPAVRDCTVTYSPACWGFMCSPPACQQLLCWWWCALACRLAGRPQPCKPLGCPLPCHAVVLCCHQAAYEW